jgi:hypothetical protein
MGKNNQMTRCELFKYDEGRVVEYLTPPSALNSPNFCIVCSLHSTIFVYQKFSAGSGLRSSFSRLCDEFEDYVARDALQAPEPAPSTSDVMTSSSVSKHVERLLEEAIGPLERDKRDLER